MSGPLDALLGVTILLQVEVSGSTDASMQQNCHSQQQILQTGQMASFALVRV